MTARQYHRGQLDAADLAADPVAQFKRWFAEAGEAGLVEPHAMTLATASGDGRPSARTVLLKGVDGRGFVFYTNLESRKGRDLRENPFAALVFHWPELERQVLVAGRVTRVGDEESDAYFHSRPLESRLGAWASRQGSVLGDRAELDARLDALRRRFADGQVPRPPHWGGLRLAPDSVEFWQGRANRLHDRLRYALDEAARTWRIERLSP